MINLDDELYDHQLIQLLELLKKIDLDQFTTDLALNDPKTFDKLKKLLSEKERFHVRKQK